MRTIISIEVGGKQRILNGLSVEDSLALAAQIDENKGDFIALEAQLAEAEYKRHEEGDLFGSQLAAARKREARMREALVMVEWVEYSSEQYGDAMFCPCCSAKKEYGHKSDCELKEALSGDPAPDARDAAVAAARELVALMELEERPSDALIIGKLYAAKKTLEALDERS